MFDVAEPVPTQIIYGQREFRIQGKKLFPKAVYFLNAALQRFDCTVVTESPDGQVYVARSNELLEPGDYKLVAKSRAGDAEGPLQTAFHRVKYLKVGSVGPAPRVTGVKDNSGMDPGPNTVMVGSDMIISGENLGDVTNIHFVYPKEGGGTGTCDVTREVITKGEGSLTLNESFWTDMSDINREEIATVTMTLTTEDGRSCNHTFYAT